MSDYRMEYGLLGLAALDLSSSRPPRLAEDDLYTGVYLAPALSSLISVGGLHHLRRVNSDYPQGLSTLRNVWGMLALTCAVLSVFCGLGLMYLSVNSGLV